MIKNFEEYINEDYFSKLANRKDKGEVRKENVITEEFVRSFVSNEMVISSITIRKENDNTIVDINGSFYMKHDVDYIPFQLGTVSGNFDCSRCEKLTSLKGCPEKVGGKFDCSSCKSLLSLDGCPEKVGYNFYCIGCGKQFTEEEVELICNVEGKIFV